MNRYKIVEANDGTFWVPLQPLIMDIRDRIDMIDDDHIVNSLQIVESFFKALLQEGTINKYDQQPNT